MRRTFRLSRSVLAKTVPADQVASDLRTLPEGAILELVDCPRAEQTFVHVLFNGEKLSIFQVDFHERSVEIKPAFSDATRQAGEAASSGSMVLDKDT